MENLEIIKKENKALLNLPTNLEERIKGAQSLFKGLENGLYETIIKSILTTKEFHIPNVKNIRVLNNEVDLITSFFLRSFIYGLEGYTEEFENGKNGLEFDKYDANSLSFGYFDKNKMVASFRIVIDKNNLGFPSEKYCSEINFHKNRFKTFEASRMVILPEYQKNTSILFNELTTCIIFARLNNFERLFYGASDEVINMYEKHGGGSETIINNIQYGKISKPLHFRSVNVNSLNDKFEKVMQRRMVS